jgi:predicted metal-binding membrane protein
MAATSAQQTRRRIPIAIPAAIAGAWTLALVAQATGKAELLHHDALLEGGPPLWVALPVFVLAWQMMVAAMMLPSTIPMVRIFGAATAGVPQRARTMTAFLGAYAAVWTLFGALAFLGDDVVHHIVDSTPWLAAHPYVIGGSVLLLAGGFQFSDLKERCLSQCRHPGAFLMKHYRTRGEGAAFAFGWKHGAFCLGCCWALMLLMFAVGVAHLWWMAALTALMVYEKVGRHGERAARIAGGLFLLAGAGVLLQSPAWLVALLAH